MLRSLLASAELLDYTLSNINKVFRLDTVASMMYEVTGRRWCPQKLPPEVMDILVMFILMFILVLLDGASGCQGCTPPSCPEPCGNASVVLGLKIM